MSDTTIIRDGIVFISLPFLIDALTETIDYGYETQDSLSTTAAARSLLMLNGMELVLTSLETFNAKA